MPNKDVVIWPLIFCVEPAVTARLIMYQWELYGQKLDIMTEPPPVAEHSFELESLEEIDHLLREKRPAPRKAR